jgi:type IV secretory pathway VirB9-like protein
VKTLKSKTTFILLSLILLVEIGWAIKTNIGSNVVTVTGNHVEFVGFNESPVYNSKTKVTIKDRVVTLQNKKSKTITTIVLSDNQSVIVNNNKNNGNIFK